LSIHYYILTRAGGHQGNWNYVSLSLFGSGLSSILSNRVSTGNLLNNAQRVNKGSGIKIYGHIGEVSFVLKEPV